MTRRHPRTRLTILGAAIATLVAVPLSARLVSQYAPSPTSTGYVAPHDPPLPLPAPPSPTPGGYHTR